MFFSPHAWELPSTRFSAKASRNNRELLKDSQAVQNALAAICGVSKATSASHCMTLLIPQNGIFFHFRRFGLCTPKAQSYWCIYL